MNTVRCNVVIRGRNRIGNYVHIYDNVCIEGGRPALVGSSTAEVPDQSIIGDGLDGLITRFQHLFGLFQAQSMHILHG